MSSDDMRCMEFGEFVHRSKRIVRDIRSGLSRTRGRNPIPHVVLHGVEHKSCSSCGSLKPLSEFGSNAGRTDGLNSSCHSCVAEGRAKRGTV